MSDTEKFQIALRQAQSGDADAMLVIAQCYYTGTGTDRNPLLAVTWLEQSIARKDDYEKDHLLALYYTGGGYGDPVYDPRLAAYWYHQAARGGDRLYRQMFNQYCSEAEDKDLPKKQELLIEAARELKRKETGLPNSEITDNDIGLIMRASKQCGIDWMQLYGPMSQHDDSWCTQAEHDRLYAAWCKRNGISARNQNPVSAPPKTSVKNVKPERESKPNPIAKEIEQHRHEISALRRKDYDIEPPFVPEYYPHHLEYLDFNRGLARAGGFCIIIAIVLNINLGYFWFYTYKHWNWGYSQAKLPIIILGILGILCLVKPFINLIRFVINKSKNSQVLNCV